MIPRINETSPVQAHYLNFIDALKHRGFRGNLNPDYANRTVLATDNSIYQVLPQGVLYPRDIDDLILIAELSQHADFTDVVLSPRGGGTGTNGQSLTDGLIVDVSKYMNQVLEINADERWVRVQTGVVKDQLNAALKPYGLFFAPELSTSNRATLGGMINTDASGQGSCRYGKTRDHVLALKTVLLGGEVCNSKVVDDETLCAITSDTSKVAQVHRIVDSIQKEHCDLIKAKFPPLNRCLTGYDLAHIRTNDHQFDLNSVLCGSEGTLGFIAEATLNVLPIPKCTALVNVYYQDFNTALRDATDLMKAEPTSIETIDSKVLGLAQGDIIWNSVAEFFPAIPGKTIEGINLVEYTADSEDDLNTEMERLIALLDLRQQNPNARSMGYSVAWGDANVQKIWAMRKKSVGLLGNANGEARPIPFVEDTAVPPEHLADFIAEFRAILDHHELAYGMFGHVDAGVLHVRPAIDMKDPQQAQLVRTITGQVVELTQKYNGLLWGEHGKGVRSEYSPQFFGELYPQLQRIKAEFDPHNQLNPGKIATPHTDTALLRIDEVTTRGEQDRKIPVQVWEGYSEGMYCNGNGACFNWNPDDMMCPSYKGTRERIHSPKGRASLIREWLKQLSERGVNPLQQASEARQTSFMGSLPKRIANSWKRKQEYDFSHEVFDAMSGCLACKSCVGQCPIKVDVPEFRSKFMELYYSRYCRPLKDYFIGGLEFMIPILAKMPWLYNGLMRPQFMQKLLAKVAGMVDSPLLTGLNLEQELQQLGVPLATTDVLKSIHDDNKARTVIIVQDAFTSYFETSLVIDVVKLLQALGFSPLLAPYHPNGKPLHVHGFLKKFTRTATSHVEQLQTLAASGISLVGIDPSMTLTYRSEYQKVLPENSVPNVQLLQEWLAQHTQILANAKDAFKSGTFKLLAHCTEKTNAAPSLKQWQSVFTQVGQQLDVIDTGCCGMAGTYGHESNHVDTSKTIYQLSWQQVVNNSEHKGQLLATGYSCRSQVKRFDQQQLPHPLQALLSQLKNSQHSRG